MAPTTTTVQPPTKRPRRDDDDDDDDDGLLWAQLVTHWQDYQTSCHSSSNNNDEDDVGDVDELMEILALATAHYGGRLPTLDLDASFPLRVPADCVPVLVSVAAHLLADHAMGDYLRYKEQPAGHEESMKESFEAVRGHLTTALTCLPQNAATWSMLANWCRMTATRNAPLGLAHLYAHAAATATRLHARCQVVLGQEEDPHELNPWIESLLLNQVLGVEYEGSDDEEEGEDAEDEAEDEETNEETVKQKSKKGDEVVAKDEINGDNPPPTDETDESLWSISAVESTARFMAALQLSMADAHDEASVQLRHFGCTHRLHPGLWQKNQARLPEDGHPRSIANEPMVFETPVLPPDLCRRLKEVFRPKAPFWLESSYSHRGYYSFFTDRLTPGSMPGNLIQDAIESHLLPLVEQARGAAEPPIVGYEWWVHTRPLAANLGHNLHFDTDEALLKSEQRVTHPVVSSVLYLDGPAGQAGPTIVLSQGPDATENASFAWRNDPVPNSCLFFPGHYLHGVLPCATAASDDKSEALDALEEIPQVANVLSEKMPAVTVDEVHRLSFMVGFWTRRVPDGIEDRERLYGPCGPLPPATEEHSWVQQICEGYPRKSSAAATLTPSKPRAVPQVSPAWEVLDTKETPSRPLVVPTALDHRFFVHNPPACFRDSLFERDEDDDDEDEEEEEEEEDEEK